MSFTDKEKEKVLLKFGYDKVVGYLFPTPPCEDYDYTFVDLNDAEPIIKCGPDTFYQNQETWVCSSLEDAFDEAYDAIYYNVELDNNQDATDELIDKYIRKEYLGDEE